MATFRDGAGRQWAVEANGDTLRRVRDRLGVNLGKQPAEGLMPLLGDTLGLVDVLYVLCQPQAEAAGVSDEEFGRAAGGPVLADARDALVAAMAEFYPSAATREAVRLLGEALKATREEEVPCST